MPARAALTTARKISKPPANFIAVHPQSLRRFVRAGHGRRDAAARRESADDLQAPRLGDLHEVVEQAVDDSLIEDALIAKALQVELQRLEFDADPVGAIGER